MTDNMTHKVSTRRYLKMHSDCIPVKGATSSAIYDLSRHRMVLFPTAYFNFVSALDGRDMTSLNDLDHCDSDSKKKFTAVIDYLIESEVVSIVADPLRFPKLETSYRRPSTIHNAIIDVDLIWHDFANIFVELDRLGCEFVQVRIFSSNYTLDKIYRLVDLASNTTIRGVELLICHNADCSSDKLIQFVSEKPLVVDVIVHSSPSNLTLEVDSKEAKELGLGTGRKVQFVTQAISSSRACGNITIESINAPSVSVFTETLNHNGCLNKKISIDADGQIKNCPSFCRSYGTVGLTALASVAVDIEFRRAWDVKKDQISVCKDCQFRYACTDCRAHVVDSADPLSKPAFCGYDPYRDVWDKPPREGQVIAEKVIYK